MRDGAQSSADATGPFDAIDPRLNMFALANGMDLLKGDGYRRLEWFNEGRERGILIESTEGGTFRVGILSWKTGSTDDATASGLGEGLSGEDVGAALTNAIDAANDL